MTATAASTASGRRRPWLRLPLPPALRTPRGRTGALLVLLVVLLGLLGPLLLGTDPYRQGRDALAGPSWDHPLGTDEVGRDLLARALAGVRTELLVCLLAVPAAAVLGTLLGLLGGLNRRLGELVQRLFDLLLGLHGLLLGLALALLVRPGTGTVVATIVLSALPSFGRQARAALLGQLARDHVVAARVLGVPRGRILRRHVLPNVVDATTALLAVAMAHAVKIEGGLSVLGLGVQPPAPSLGAMINAGSKYLFLQPGYALTPVVLLGLLVFGLTLLADSFNRERLR
ncbi:ABC transporter permease [Streptomyces sp. FH025]|uniref:ABC transporter permease n=1 Tax=Streptomyces sp. FH025 TaxID=2815937 RepID=UPI001A9CCF5A|nr:ABC transporter permease subunit [Streptomyces sp. FH025]MBO1419788.1 ABC transporter permease [Streptomyces sp. FH025]